MIFWNLRMKLHVSWFIATTSMGIVVGMVMVQFVDQTLFSSWIWFLVAGILLLIAFLKKKVYLLCVALVAGSLLGFWRGSLERQSLTVYSSIIGQTLTISGTVSDDVDIDKKQNVVMRLDRVLLNDKSIPGKLWITTSTEHHVKRSDTVTIRGKISKGFASFNASIYHAEVIKVEMPEPGDIALNIRDWFADAIRQVVHEPAASLGIGYLVGQRRDLPPELVQSLQIAGLTHIIVASGYNLTILVRLARRLFEKVSKYLSALSATLMIFGFIAISGVSPSMSRAGLVAGLALLAWYYGRKFHPLVLLPFAAAITVLINPSYAWNDLGWQLSFAAFAGVMVLSPLLQAFFFGNKKPGTVRQILGETVSAQIVTFPILIYTFGLFSNVAVITNLLVLPLVPLAMLLTFVAGLAALVIPSMANIIALPAEWLLDYMIAVATLFASLPWAQTEIRIEWWHACFMYICIIAACFYMWRRTRYSLRDSNIIE